MSTKWDLRARVTLLVGSAALACAAIFLPVGWYDVLPRPADAPARLLEGTTLLRLTFLIESALLGTLALTGWKPGPDIGAAPSATPLKTTPVADLSRDRAFLCLCLVVVAAIALRGHRLGTDLWLDEIGVVSTYAARPLIEIYAHYLSPGNHLLNSLLVKLSVSAFGESEWSARFPAAAFGVATIPIMYFAAREAMSRAASVGAALLLAISYHHIYFSQNARGYSAHLFFALLSSALLASVLRREHSLKWTAYVLAMALGFAALMTTAFLFAAHITVGAIAIASRRRRGIPARHLALRLGTAFSVAGLLGFQIYAVSIPDVVAIYQSVYSVQGSGYILLSRELAAELMRGVSAGFILGVSALPFAAVAAAGLLILMRRSWPLAASLLLSLVWTVVYLVVRGQSIAPRLFLVVVPLAILSCMASIDAVGARLSAKLAPGSRLRRGTIILSASALPGALSLLALPAYYAAPKQAYRAAIRYIEAQRGAAEQVIVVYPAVGGFRYYLGKQGVRDTADYRFVTTASEYQSAFQSLHPRQGLLTTTLLRVLRSDTPLLADRIIRDWVPVRTFRGTVGDGDILVWRRAATDQTTVR